MAGTIEPRIRVKMSKSELERRWKAVRLAMKESNLDFLIMQNYTGILGGYVKWFSDMSAHNNYPFTLIFPREDDMTTIMHGPRQTRQSTIPGIKKQINVPALPSFAFSKSFEAEAVAAELSAYPNCHIGLVGMGFINAAFYNYLTKTLNKAEFSDATDLVDNIKAIKSAEEIEHIKEICAIQDMAFEYALSLVKPGRTDNEIYADILRYSRLYGSEESNLAVGSAQPGTATPSGGKGESGTRQIREGDQVTILIETSGPSGYFAEIMRTVCLGKIPSELQEQYEVAQKAQKVSLDLLKPGADPLTIWNAVNQYLRTTGYPEEKRVLSHGIGCDMMERPSVQVGETMKIRAGMSLAAHATVPTEKAFAAVCENHLVTETGNICLHKTPQIIFQI
jgi:Xaa-Pro aminopeptidase